MKTFAASYADACVKGVLQMKDQFITEDNEDVGRKK